MLYGVGKCRESPDICREKCRETPDICRVSPDIVGSCREFLSPGSLPSYQV
jgi:hypothetical protein